MTDGSASARPRPGPARLPRITYAGKAVDAAFARAQDQKAENSSDEEETGDH